MGLSNRILKSGAHCSGYRIVVLWRDNKGHTKTVHRLVAIAFLGDPKNREVNHKNRIKNDNMVGNLEYLTRRENIRHGIANGSMRSPGKIRQYAHTSGVNHHKAKLSENQVIKIFNSQEKLVSLSEKYGVSFSTVSAILTRKTWVRVTSKLKQQRKIKWHGST